MFSSLTKITKTAFQEFKVVMQMPKQTASALYTKAWKGIEFASSFAKREVSLTSSPLKTLAFSAAGIALVTDPSIKRPDEGHFNDFASTVIEYLEDDIDPFRTMADLAPGGYASIHKYLKKEIAKLMSDPSSFVAGGKIEVSYEKVGVNIPHPFKIVMTPHDLDNLLNGDFRLTEHNFQTLVFNDVGDGGLNA